MPGYTDPFGGSSVQPAQVAYRAVALSADVTLVWPPLSVSATDYVARIMDVTPSGAGFDITMPDATAVSPGFDVIFLNPGANSYNVLDNAGATIVTVAPGAAQYVYLRANATPAGTWGVLQFASLASAVSAAALAGPGIAAAGASLYATSVTTTFSSNYALLTSDRTKTFVWTGGTGTLTLPTSGAAGNDFYVEVANQGTGSLTITRSSSDTIDGATTLVLQGTESCILHANGSAEWYSVGRGRNTQFNFTLLTKAVTGGTVTLSNTEAANVVQKYTGVLTSTLNVVLPSTVQVYYVSNQTTGAFSSTWKTAGVGTTVTIPQGQNAVLFCDGVNVVNSSTTVSGISSLSINPGAVGSPSISFVGDATTGIYQSVAGRTSFASAGVAVGEYTSAGSTALAFVPTGSTVPTNGMYLSAANQVSFATNSAARYTINSAGNHTMFVPGAGTTLTIEGLTASSSTALIVQAAAPGFTLSSRVSNTDNTNAASHARQLILSGGASGGDAYTEYQVNAVTSWVMGVDNSAGDRFAISFGSTLGTNNILEAASTGEVGFGLNPVYRLDVLSTAATAQRLASTDLNSVIARFATGTSVERGYIGAGSAIFTSGVNTEFGLDAVTTLVLSTGSVKRLTINSSGNVTINAPSSGTAFTVAGLGKFGTGTAAPTSGQVLINNPNATATRLQLFQDSQESWAIGMNASSTVLRVQASGVDALTITNTNLATFAGTTQIATNNSGLPAATGGGLYFDYASSISRTYIGDGTGYNWKWSKRTGSATTDYFTVFDDGRFAGHALHNNAGSVTGATNQYIASGTYTPTFTNGTNVAASASPSGFWIRVGNVVTVWVTGTIDPTAAGTSTLLGISLPIASNLTGNDLLGTSAHDQSGTSILPGTIASDVVNDRAQLQFFPTDTASRGFSSQFGYIVA